MRSTQKASKTKDSRFYCWELLKKNFNTISIEEILTLEVLSKEIINKP